MAIANLPIKIISCNGSKIPIASMYPRISVIGQSGATIRILDGLTEIDSYTLGASETEHTFTIDSIGVDVNNLFAVVPTTYNVAYIYNGTTRTVSVYVDSVTTFPVNFNNIDVTTTYQDWVEEYYSSTYASHGFSATNPNNFSICWEGSTNGGYSLFRLNSTVSGYKLKSIYIDYNSFNVSSTVLTGYLEIGYGSSTTNDFTVLDSVSTNSETGVSGNLTVNLSSVPSNNYVKMRIRKTGSYYRVNATIINPVVTYEHI